jgi:hypothetical protein
MTDRLKYKVTPGFEFLEEWIRNLPEYFPDNGESIFKSRNEVKIFNVGELQLNVKAFKIPNWFNRIVYVYFRNSKAARSFNYASKFYSLDIPTPEAVAYLECLSFGLLGRSYYISLHYNYDFTLREVLNYQVPERDEILRQWTRFTHQKLHLNNIYHLDYSPGNTLIKKDNGIYEFNIIDLNRMKFKKIDFEKGIRNFRQLDTDRQTLELLASEYAMLRGEDTGKAFQILIASDHKNKLSRQRRGSFKKILRSVFKSGRVA